MTAEPPKPASRGWHWAAEAGALLARRGESARRVLGRPLAARAARPVTGGWRRHRVDAAVPPVWAGPGEDGGYHDNTGQPAEWPAPSRFESAAPPPGMAPSWPAPSWPAPPEPGRPLAGHLRDRLRPVVGPGVDRMVLHDGAAAEGLVAAHAAAALTVGEQVYLGRGRFRPDRPDGLALLAHEAWHVALGGDTSASWRRASPAGRALEERAAHRRGALAAELLSPVPVAGTAAPVGRTRPLHPAIGRPGGQSGGRRAEPQGPPARLAPGTATASPVLSPGPSAGAMAAPLREPLEATRPAEPTGPDPAGAGRSLALRELMRQLRVERERGA